MWIYPSIRDNICPSELLWSWFCRALSSVAVTVHCLVSVSLMFEKAGASMQANSGSDEDDLCFSLPRAPSGVPPLEQGVICQVLLFVPLIACLVSFSACGTNSVTSPPSPFVAPTPTDHPFSHWLLRLPFNWPLSRSLDRVYLIGMSQ